MPTRKKNNLVYNVPNISSLAALEIINTGFKEAIKYTINITISVVDRSLNLVAFARGDGATPHSIETSRRKANTSASTGKPTGWMDKDLSILLPMASNNQLTNIPGGVPIRFKGEFLGGIGVAGGTTDQDYMIALSIVKIIGADESD